MWKAENGSHRIKPLNTLFAISQHSIVRWTLTLAWTALAAYLMLAPASSGSTVKETSKLFGGSDITDAIGHVIIHAILAFLWRWTLSLYMSPAKTTRLILIGGLIWCVGAELVQHFVPNRGASLLDLGANILGVVSGLVAYRSLIEFRYWLPHSRRKTVQRHNDGV